MKVRWQLRVALAAGIAGTAMLTVWFAKFWPSTAWTVSPRAELIEKAKQISGHFGLDTSNWNAYVVPTTSRPLAHYARTHPKDSNALAVSPLSVRITLSKAGQKAEAGLDSKGSVLYWSPPAEFKPLRKFSSDDDAADAAFHFLAGPHAADFEDRQRSMGDKDREEDYSWRKSRSPNSDIKEKIKVATRSSVIQKAARKIGVGNDDEDSDTGDSPKYWDILGGLFGVLSSAGAVIVIGIYILWFTRRALSHKFPLRIAGVYLVVAIATLVLGTAGEKARSAGGDGATGTVIGILFETAMMLCLTAVGRGISLPARPKWMSLEQLCLMAPKGNSTGESLLAGLLFSPLLVAVPFLVAACGLFPGSWVLPRNTEILYSRAQLLDSINIGSATYLLGFFGFVVPALTRMIGTRWLRWILFLLLGIALFADAAPAVSGPLAAALSTGLITFILFWFIYAHFDLLSVLTLQFTSGLLLSAVILAQKGGNIWGIVAALVCSAALAFWFLIRGQAVAEGDPLATNPIISGFRAEREKLKAEFSVARRAQQDMLPQSPPIIPGYTIAASCTPSLEVGGDLYDFLKLPDGRIAIGVADVSGKGVPAALYMTLTKGLLSSVARDSSDPSRMMEEVNRHLHSVTRKKVFVTMVLGFLDSENRVMECVRAGHNPVVWRQAGRDATTLVSPGGLGLGITAGRVFSTQMKVAQIELNDGDAIVFYSDGITEAMNSGFEQFGEQRLIDAVNQTDHLDAAGTHDFILAEVKDFLGGVHPQDDMTLVVLRVGILN